MRIKPDEIVAGFPARKIRDLLRQSVDSLSARDATKFLGLGSKPAVQLLERLEHGGFLERNPDLPNSDRERSWKRTVKGGALANALFSTRVSRQSARKTVAGFLDRVREVNSNRRFLYGVRRVVVFGSYLGDAPFVGDVDMAVDLCPKENDTRKHAELIRARAEQVFGRGRRFRNYVEALRFAEQEVMDFLKARSRTLQFTQCDDGVLSISESRVIFEGPEQNAELAMGPVPKLRVRRSRKRNDDCPF
jgi:predicted nucleotidyltransferase